MQKITFSHKEATSLNLVKNFLFKLITKNSTNLFILGCNSIDEIEPSLKNLSSNSDFKSETPYRDQLSSSELILNEL